MKEQKQSQKQSDNLNKTRKNSNKKRQKLQKCKSQSQKNQNLLNKLSKLNQPKQQKNNEKIPPKTLKDFRLTAVEVLKIFGLCIVFFLVQATILSLFLPKLVFLIAIALGIISTIVFYFVTPRLRYKEYQKEISNEKIDA